MKISQREAHRLKARVAFYEKRDIRLTQGCLLEWPDGIVIGSIAPTADVFSAVKTARRLGHAVVVHDANDGRLVFSAVKDAARTE